MASAADSSDLSEDLKAPNEEEKQEAASGRVAGSQPSSDIGSDEVTNRRFICKPILADRLECFSPDEVLEIFADVHSENLSTAPPVLPSAGCVFIYKLSNKCTKQDIRADQYSWVNSGAIGMPKGAPVVKKYFFYLKTGPDHDENGRIKSYSREFCKYEYEQIGALSHYLLVQYVGNHTLWNPVVHGNSTKAKPFVRTMKSVKNDVLTEGVDAEPMITYRSLINASGVPGEYEAVAKPRNPKQVKNYLQNERIKFRIGRDGIMNCVDLYYELDGFVWSVTPVPNLLIPLGNRKLLEIAGQLASLETTGNGSFCLYYDTTFSMGDFYVSPLCFRHPLFEGEPVIPLAFLIHLRKYQEDHTLFWRQIRKLCPELGKYTFPIVTDREFKQIDKEFPKAKHFFCWNHLLDDVERWVTSRNGTVDDKRFYYSEVIALLKKRSEEEFEKAVEERKEKWAEPFRKYFETYLHLDIKTKCARWILEENQFYNPISGVTTNPAESFNAVLHRWSKWKEAPVDSFVMSLYYLCRYFEHEIQRGLYGTGTMELKQKYKHLQKKAIFMPDFPRTYPPDEIVDRIRKRFDEKVNEAPPIENEQAERACQSSVECAPRSQNPIHDLALDALRNKKIHHCPDARCFNVVAPDGAIFAVKLFPKQVCSCNIKGCWHLLAVRIFLGDPGETKEKQEENLTLLTKKRRLGKPGGRKGRNLRDEIPEPINRKIKEAVAVPISDIQTHVSDHHQKPDYITTGGGRLWSKLTSPLPKVSAQFGVYADDPSDATSLQQMAGMADLTPKRRAEQAESEQIVKSDGTKKVALEKFDPVEKAGHAPSKEELVENYCVLGENVHVKSKMAEKPKTASKDPHQRLVTDTLRYAAATEADQAGPLDANAHRKNLSILRADPEVNAKRGKGVPNVVDNTTSRSNLNKELYCICRKESSGKMIGCDNPNCKIDWFHFKCVGLKAAPPGEWYCPLCTNAGEAAADDDYQLVGCYKLQPKRFEFVPVSAAWMRSKCTNLNLEYQHCRPQFVASPKTALDSPPRTTERIIGDGNCLFRSLCHVVTGSQESHLTMRKLLCQQIQRNPKRYLESETAQAYFRRSNMKSNYVYGTDVELRAAADLLETEIWCYAPQVDRYMWVNFKPEVCSEGKIFIVNRRSHFEPLYKW